MKLVEMSRQELGRNSSVSNVTKETKSATKDATKETKERQLENGEDMVF